MNPLLTILLPPNSGYCSLSGYSVDGFKHYEASCLLDCIMDGYNDFIPAAIVTIFRLRNCIDFIFWRTFNRINNDVFTTLTNIIFWSIKHIIEPYCTIDACILILCVLFTPLILCVYFFTKLLPKFNCCRHNKRPLLEYKTKSEIKITKYETNQVVVSLLFINIYRRHSRLQLIY